MKHLRLIEPSFDAVFGTLIYHVLLLDTAIVDLLTKILSWTYGLLLNLIRDVQGGIITRLGYQLPTTLPDHLQSIVTHRAAR